VGPRRLSVALAEAGVASRRGAEEVIRSGRVKVNGKLETLPQTKVDPARDALFLDDAPLGGASQGGRPAKHFYFAVNKPKGYVCTSQRGRGNSKLIDDLFQEWLGRWAQRNSNRNDGAPLPLPPRLVPVDRLDSAATGLVLVTNNGRWAQQVCHPSSGLTKEYVVTTHEPVTRKEIRAIVDGVQIEEKLLKPKEAEVMADKNQSNQSRCRVRIVLEDGRPQEVRALLEGVGVRVKALKRTRVGGFRLGQLALGIVQELKPNDVKRVLDKSLQGNVGPTLS